MTVTELHRRPTWVLILSCEGALSDEDRGRLLEVTANGVCTTAAAVIDGLPRWHGDEVWLRTRMPIDAEPPPEVLEALNASTGRIQRGGEEVAVHFRLEKRLWEYQLSPPEQARAALQRVLGYVDVEDVDTTLCIADVISAMLCPGKHWMLIPAADELSDEMRRDNDFAAIVESGWKAMEAEAERRGVELPVYAVVQLHDLDGGDAEVHALYASESGAPLPYDGEDPR